MEEGEEVQLGSGRMRRKMRWRRGREEVVASPPGWGALNCGHGTGEVEEGHLFHRYENLEGAPGELGGHRSVFKKQKNDAPGKDSTSSGVAKAGYFSARRI